MDDFASFSPEAVAIGDGGMLEARGGGGDGDAVGVVGGVADGGVGGKASNYPFVSTSMTFLVDASPNQMNVRRIKSPIPDFANASSADEV